MDLDLKVSPISVDEIDSIVILDRLCFGGLWSIDSYRREMTNENSHFVGITIDRCHEPETNGIIAYGCFWAILDEAHITLLGVHPRYEGKKLAQLLLCSLLDRARQIDMARATLEVKDTNLTAIHIYEKYGFKVAGRRKNYYQATGEDAIIMWRSGLQHPHFSSEVQSWITTIQIVSLGMKI